MKTLFGKLVTIQIGVLILGFILLTMFMSNGIEDYMMKEREDELIKQAKRIENQYQSVFDRGIVDLDKLGMEMEILNKYMNADIWLINRNGQIYVNSMVEDVSKIQKELKFNEIARVFKGDTVKRRGYFKSFYNEPVLTVGYPIKINGEVVLALFMHKSIPEINKTVSGIYKIALLALIFSTSIAIIMVFLMSKNITNKISLINRGAKRIAKGDFESTIEIDEQDELGELATSFNEMASELGKVEELRQNIISNISHDLRSPLTSIKGFIQAMLDGTIEGEKGKKYLEITLNETERLTKLTNDILEISKMQGGQIKLNKEKFNINSLIINELDKFEDRIDSKGIDVDIRLLEDNYMVFADQNEINRVVYNLLDNAVKFVKPNGLIGIKMEKKKNKITVSITNSTDPISREELKHIWDRFNKLDVSRGKDVTGFGLGLSIVREILKAHGEDIEVLTHEGEYIEFIFTLSTIDKK